MADQPFSRKNLVEIGEELGKVDVESLKFLCKDVLPRRSIQKMDRATQIFISLLEKGKLKPDDGDFLLQCLYYMKKHNIIKKLGYRCEDIEKNIKEKKYKVTPYRAMLFELSEDLDKDEIETIKFSMKEKYSMKKNQMDRLRSGLNIMDTLETDGHIDETNVKDLENFILQVLGRDDLKKYFDEYFGVTAPIPVETEPINVTQGQKTHGFLTSSSSQAPRVPIGHTNVDVSMHGARIHTVPLESRQPIEDAPDTNIMTNDIPSYKMTADPRGFCIIINNENFIDENKNRRGSDKDVERLIRTFTNRKFLVQRYDDLRANDITSILKEFSTRDHTMYDALVVCILSHGDINTIQGTDSIHVQIGKLTALFRSSECKSLTGKPKLFFIQACQGQEKNKVTVPSGTQQDSVETDIKIDESQTPTPPIPGEPDFLLGFACVPGYVSYRRRSTGSIYIEKLTNAIDRFADRCDLSTILLQVNHDVSDEKLEIPVEISAQGSIAGQQPSQQVNRFIACSAPLNALRRQLFL